MLTLALAGAFSSAAPTAQVAAASAPISGIDLQYLDPAVRPQDDLNAHVNGKWIKSVEIPADQSKWGAFAIVRERTKEQVRAIIEAAQADKSRKAGTNTQKIGDLYASFMDEKRLDALGYKPLAGELAKIRALKTKTSLPALMARLEQMGVTTPYEMDIWQDAKEPTRYSVYIGQSGLGMPDRDYYLKKDDVKLAGVRAKYEEYVAQTLAMVGHKNAPAAAAAVLAFETELAQVQWTKVALRDIPPQYNKVDLAKIDAMTPGFAWAPFMEAAGVAGKADFVIAMQPSYFLGASKAIENTDLDTLKAYFEWQLVRSYAPYLSAPFAQANFAFHGNVVTGAKEIAPRWKRGGAIVDTSLGEALGQRYVELHFPAERKARMEQLVANMLSAFKSSIDALEWMSPATKKEAQTKLSLFTPKIGYPDKWIDYGPLTIKPNDLAGNVMRARAFAHQRELGKLGKPIDRSEWLMTPQAVNAYYNALSNEIVFPAAFLQPPFFDMRADDAVNYGAVGAVIGHEIGHGFDDVGSTFDGTGALRQWWTKDDSAAFKTRTGMLVTQYSAYVPLPGYPINGELTLGENIGDNSGLALAYKAYQIALGGKPAPVIDGLTGDQRFYIGFAQAFRSKFREPALIAQLKTDPHSPGEYRVNGTVVNQPAFYEAFGVKEGDKLYVAPKDRVKIW
ncbi:MAG: M13-type metalloendopeptidase [Pseudomonadota bacterium]